MPPPPASTHTHKREGTRRTLSREHSKRSRLAREKRRACAFDPAFETAQTVASAASPSASPAAAPPDEEDRACQRREEEELGGTWRETRASQRVTRQGGANPMQRRQRPSERARAEIRGPATKKVKRASPSTSPCSTESERCSSLAAATPAEPESVGCLREPREGVEGYRAGAGFQRNNRQG